mgnify:CR=1 FL=1
MASRLTTAAVEVLDTEAGHTMALVQGQRRTYVVDHNPAWSDRWLCTCEPQYKPADGSDCRHIRLVKEKLA